MREYKNIPYAYFITFTTYGTWLHGDQRGSVDPKHNNYIKPKLKPTETLYVAMHAQKNYKVFTLTKVQRKIVLNAIKDTCNHYNWRLFAVHVRSNHIHLIVQAVCDPEKVMGQLKAYCSRYLNAKKLYNKQQKYWTRHGSTRYVWSSHLLFPVMQYVIDGQGERMACDYEDWYDHHTMNHDQ